MKLQIYLSLLFPTLLICGNPNQDPNEKRITIDGCPWTLNISCSQQINAWQLQCRNVSNHLKFSFSCLQQSPVAYSLHVSATSQETCRLGNKCQNPCNGRSGNDYITISSSHSSAYDINLHGSGCWLNVTQNADGQTGIALRLIDKNKTWIKALQNCSDSSSTLVEITNPTMQDAVTNLINETGLENSAWVGLERSIFGINPKWIWTSQTKTTYPEINIRDPVDPLNNHCGKVVLVRGEAKLVDEDCQKSLPFICQD